MSQVIDLENGTKKLNLHYRKGRVGIKKPIKLLKSLIWVYFILLIFEGGLRKWILPGLAEPLLIIRDPIAIWIILLSVKHDILPFNFYVIGALIVNVLCIYTAIAFGHGNFWVALFGARIFLIHFVLIFAIGRIFTIEDVVGIGKFTLWLAVPMTFLIALQFYSPQSAWVNRGVGGDLAGAGFIAVNGYYRPPGTFSFTNGNALFFSFLSCFVFYFWVQPQGTSRSLLIAATVALIAAVPFSISRGLYFSVFVSGAFALSSTVLKPKYFLRILLGGMGFFLIYFIVTNAGFLQEANSVFNNRLEGASKSEGGVEGTLIDRYLGSMTRALFSQTEGSFFGVGLGMGTNVGSMLLKGNRTFLVDEGEWGRLIGEVGFLFGCFLIFLRLHLCYRMAIASYKNLRGGNLMPWVLLSFGLLSIPQGQWAQPTALGFSALIGGLILAALRSPAKDISVKSTPGKSTKYFRETSLINRD